jgi:methylmalonyl-CoA mutase
VSDRNEASAPRRYVTATALFDGHDASINMIRRLLHNAGCEVVHLGHNRSVQEIVIAVIDEDADAVAVSSYQGGHVEFFTYLVDELRQRGHGDVQVVGGGGGVIIDDEIAALEAYGVAKIFSPADGARIGLDGMAQQLVEIARRRVRRVPALSKLVIGERDALAQIITAVQDDSLERDALHELRERSRVIPTPVLGVTGTGGSGKSSLTDEIVRRFRLDQADQLKIAVIAVDPSRRRGGGALLGDRIRMNSLDSDQIYFRSLAARGASGGLPDQLADVVGAAKLYGADLIIVETPGIGQGDGGIEDLATLSVYVMTPEYGASSQLEKIEMLDVADLVAINKFERRGASEAYRDVRRQLARRFKVPPTPEAQLPVFGTVAARFNDDGVSALYFEIKRQLAERGLVLSEGALSDPAVHVSSRIDVIIPADRVRYLSEISSTVRAYHEHTAQLVEHVRDITALERTVRLLKERDLASNSVRELAVNARESLDPEAAALLDQWPERKALWQSREGVVDGRAQILTRISLSGTEVPRVALPDDSDAAALLDFLRRENLPGSFPFSAGVFSLSRDDEEPTRMFAGEGDAARTNKRFHLLAEGQPSTRLSTAFDSVTLYGFNPDPRPDIYGKVGNAGVSISTIDDMRILYGDFDLCDPSTSVSMTINGPAPAILAMFLNVAIDQQLDRFVREDGHQPSDSDAERVRSEALAQVRGTVQADILKEDQGQNTCILSTEFALRMMSDVQEWFVHNDVRRFYSVSVSGYHIAEAGANPITQLALTLANGFTYVEAWLARGLTIDEIAPSLSFFFSNGMDVEYTVLGRVARRIWAIAMRERYGANERSQKLKYHVQTSGRSLHAQEMSFNDIRTTLQALCAIYDRANSLHTNAFDEAVTTPTNESVRRAMAIQLIINREWGLAQVANPLQGSFIVDELSELVEAAVLSELDALSDRGGVLGAMELGYQRGRIQDESLLYEQRKHDGSLPLIGVNTFVGSTSSTHGPLELARSTEAEKQNCLHRLSNFHEQHASESTNDLQRLRQAALKGENTFAVLMDAVRTCSLGQITDALFEVGGRYRRNL